jgi:hypothetical protein
MGVVVSTLISYALRQTANTVLNMDEVSHETLPDGRLKVVLVTSALVQPLAKFKTYVWAFCGLPLQKVDECTIEELQAGPLFKRYRITAILSPIGAKPRGRRG